MHRSHSRVMLHARHISPLCARARLYSDKTEHTRRTALLECERKFNITSLLHSHLNQSKAIRNLHFKRAPDDVFQDQYFDIHDSLQVNGIWLRLRTDFTQDVHRTVWEAKISQGKMSDYTNTKFEEVSGSKKIYAAIKQRVPTVPMDSLAELSHRNITAAIHTRREVWKQSNVEESGQTSLQIVLDRTSSVPLSEMENCSAMGHAVGEVEAMRRVQLSDDEEANEKMKTEELAIMDAVIREFMVGNKLFPTQPAPVGKLSAYFEWKKAIMKEPWPDSEVAIIGRRVMQREPRRR